MGSRKISFIWYGFLLATLWGKNTIGQMDSMQCQRKGETCWCVDHLTGVEIEGSRVLLKQGIPLCGRFETELYYLNSTNAFCTAADEVRVNKCLGNLYGTFLDLPYAHSNFNHLLFANYVFLSGKLDLACRLFEDYHQCSSSAFNNTACRHCQHIVFTRLFDYLCRPRHLVTIKQQISCLQGLFMDETFIQCQLRLLDELKAVQQQSSDAQRLCAIRLQLQVCLLKRLPLYCEQDMIKILAVLPERVVEGLNVSCDGFLSLSTLAPGAKPSGVTISIPGLTSGEVPGKLETISPTKTYATFPVTPTKMEERLRTPEEETVSTGKVSQTPTSFEFTPHRAELLPSAAGETKEPSIITATRPILKTEEGIAPTEVYPTPLSEEVGKTKIIEAASTVSKEQFTIATVSSAFVSAEGMVTDRSPSVETATATPEAAAGKKETTMPTSVILGAVTTAEGAITAPVNVSAAGRPFMPVSMETFEPGMKEPFGTSLPTMETAELSMEQMKSTVERINEVAAVIAEHSTRLPGNITERLPSPEWERSPATVRADIGILNRRLYDFESFKGLPEGKKTPAGATPSEFPASSAPIGTEPSGRTPSYGVSEAVTATIPFTPRTTYEEAKEGTPSSVPTISSVLTEITAHTEVGKTLPSVAPSVSVSIPGEKPETAFVEDRSTSTVRISEPTERRYEETGKEVGTSEGPLGVTVPHYVIPVVDSQIHLVPSPAGRNVSELIAPVDVDCSGYNVRFNFCFRTHFFPVSLGQLTVENLLNNSWHWPKLAEVCRFFHDYLNCMYQPSLNPMGLCDPFGHSALVGMLNAICEHDVATALHLNSHCLSSTLRNVSWANQCVGTLVDFVRIVHYLPVNDGHVCQRIRDMHSCINTLDLSSCGEDLQFALAKLKLTGLQAETYLCGKYLLGPVLREQVEWWNRRRANDLPFEEIGCLEERRRVLRSNVANERYVPQCNHKGYYNLVQCDYSVGQCWCVDVESGLEQAKSRKPLTENIVCGVCFVHKAQLLNDTESRQSVPRCLNNGLYAPLQCNFGASECWCVDEQTGAELMYTRVYKSGRLPRCNVRSEFSCSWIPPKKRCAPDGSAPKLVLRWFREGWKCILRPVSFCPHESHLPPYTFRFQSDCEEMCLGPYAAKLPVRYIA
ncbi:hypothetical protein M514_24146 [Trichuris suis]|uniref:Thyroglobulin type-1 domain-containing protein n=1 Tax=Trichuris suis TaxID=68888 RepID=A0A085N2K6_9BILA|nr:hypothetical protein M514_24146 [Trichuris suis]